MVGLMPFIHAPAVVSDEADCLLVSSFAIGAVGTAGAVLADDIDNPGAVSPSGPSNESPCLATRPSVGNTISTSPLYV
jgi:hypothetical protein